MAISSAKFAPKPARAYGKWLERGLLTEAELDDIFSPQNLMHPAYKAKRYTDESEQ
jgi:aspartate ammonia-lyase